MHWPAAENVVRIDGKDKKSMLILRESLGLSREQFTHQYASELLRAALSTSISALDRYMHDQIVSRSIGLLRRRVEDIPKELGNLRIPALTVKNSLEKLRSNVSARPGSILKKDLQDVLHRDETFQSVSGVERGAKLLGLKDFWKCVTNEMDGFTKPGDVQSQLKKIATRRNQIVHEADLILQQRARKPKLREISIGDAQGAIGFVELLVQAIDRLIENG